MTKAEQALLAVVRAVRDYLPNGDPQECLNRILEAIDNPEMVKVVEKLERRRTVRIGAKSPAITGQWVPYDNLRG